jgi:hypothetical protein
MLTSIHELRFYQPRCPANPIAVILNRMCGSVVNFHSMATQRHPMIDSAC